MTADTPVRASNEQPGRYQPGVVEAKWQQRWAERGLYRTPDRVAGLDNWYALTMFPYTSGDLHIGHWFAMAPSDALARWRRMLGHNVLFPIGFDAFGLPAENAAIKRGGGLHPKDWTDANIIRMRGQLQRMGAMFDWDREVNTSSPTYYRWTQWWFLQLYRMGLAYRADANVNWCPSCQTVLANEQVVDGRCERCDTTVVQRRMEQWFLRTTAYADELLRNQDLDWPEHVKLMQRNWIGRSEGAEASFMLDHPLADGTAELTVFTTRPDTIGGVTFMALAPEHPLADELTTAGQRAAVEAYRAQAATVTEIERQSTEREKTGVFTGSHCINRLTGERVQIWIADYVLASYGTGAVMGVPAHDQRDFEFAAKYDIPVRVVIAPPDWVGAPLTEAYVAPGTVVNSGRFDGMHSDEAKRAVADYLAGQGWGGPTVVYRLRDWLISRQRYWGAPIPMIYCDSCGIVPVPDDQLPVELPYDVEFQPTGDSPLARHEAFWRTTCPRCGAEARRETDTMDTFMCSSWYFMRYPDAHNTAAPVGRAAADAWLPVDQYTGGAEHAVMHLLYARFFHKAARDAGVVPGDEPFIRYFSQGQILGPDGRRMSKSRGNVVAPDAQVEKWGADTFRAYLMFLGPWEQGGPYDVDGIVGVARWLNRVWSIATDPPVPGQDAESAAMLRREAHATLQRVTEDLGNYRLNTMVAALMELTNTLVRTREAGQPVDGGAWSEAVELLLLMLAPSCPHIAEELWEQTGHAFSIHEQPWPQFDAAVARADTVEIAVQVNGKVRDRLAVGVEADEASVRALASERPRVAEQLAGAQIAKVIYVPGRLLNLVVR